MLKKFHQRSELFSKFAQGASNDFCETLEFSLNSVTFDLKFDLCCKWSNYYLQFTGNKRSIETKLFIILFKLAQLVKFMLKLI